MSQTLAENLAWLGTPDCTCPSEWRSLGVLYGVSFGKGWVRMSTTPGCPYHDPAASSTPTGDSR